MCSLSTGSPGSRLGPQRGKPTANGPTALKTSPTQAVDPKNGLTFPRLDCATALEVVLYQPVPALQGGGSALAAALLLGVGLWQIWRRPGGYCSDLRAYERSLGAAQRAERDPTGKRRRASIR